MCYGRSWNENLGTAGFFVCVSESGKKFSGFKTDLG